MALLPLTLALEAAAANLSVSPPPCCSQYGYRPFPAEVPASELVLLKQCLREDGGDEAKAALVDLEAWFLPDENSSLGGRPLEFLRPATEDFWAGPFPRMQAALRRAAARALQRGALPPERADAYRISVTHAEVRDGLRWVRRLGAGLAGGIAVLRRWLTDLNVVDDKAALFTDVMWTAGDPRVDGDAATCLAELRGPELAAVDIPEAHCLDREAMWDARGVCPAAHALYLRDALDSICRILAGSVLDTARTLRQIPEPRPLCVEVGAHWALARARAERHVGRADVLTALQNFLVPPAHGAAPPSFMVLVAESGAGKTSCLSLTAVLTSEGLPAGGALVLRLLGTTADSRGSDDLLRSIADQLDALAGGNADGTNALTSATELIDRVRSLLAASSGHASPLLLVLDSLDQLDARARGGDPAAAPPLNWLSALLPLPPHVRLLASTLPDADLGCLKALQGMAALAPAGSFRFIDLERAPPHHWLSTIDAWLAADGRLLQPRQREELDAVLTACPLPLMARLAYAPARTWRSADAPVLRQAAPMQAAVPLGRSLVDMIGGLFEALEMEHGETPVSRAFGLLSASQGGLSRSELLVRDRSLPQFLPRGDQGGPFRCRPTWRKLVSKLLMCAHPMRAPMSLCH